MPGLWGSPFLASSGDGRLELFVFGDDRALWHIWQTAWSNGWSAWTRRGGPWADPVEPAAAAPSADERLELFVAAGTLEHDYQGVWSNGWAPWFSHGAPPAPPGLGFYAPGIAPNADGRLFVFVAAQQLFHVEQTAWSNGWTGWQSSGAPPGTAGVFGPPAAILTSDGRIEVFVLDGSGTLWNIHQQAPAGSWSGWNSLGNPGSPLDDRPDAVLISNGRLQVFVRSRDNQLWRRVQPQPGAGAPWGNWIAEGTAGGGLIDHPSVARNADGRLEVFMGANDGGVGHKWETAVGGTWSGWTSEGSPGGGLRGYAPCLARNGDGRLEVFCVAGPDASLWHKWQTRASNGWSAWATQGHP
jgi:hypothetical protein